MIIAIDIDNTCIKSSSWVHKVLNIKPDLISVARKKPYKINDKSKDNPTLLNKFIGVFKNKNYYAVSGAPVAINNLQKEHIVYLLSSRPSWLKSVVTLTKQNIKSAGINCDAIFLNCCNKDKFCKDFNVDIFIDNSVQQCLSVLENSSSKPFCINKKYSEGLIDGINYIKDWQNVYSFAKVIEIQNAEERNYFSTSYINKLKNQFKIYSDNLAGVNTFDYNKVNNMRLLKNELLQDDSLLSK